MRVAMCQIPIGDDPKENLERMRDSVARAAADGAELAARSKSPIVVPAPRRPAPAPRTRAPRRPDAGTVRTSFAGRPRVSAPPATPPPPPAAAPTPDTAGQHVSQVGESISSSVQGTGSALAQATQPLAPPVSAAVQQVLNVVAELVRRSTKGVGGALDTLVPPR
jgi:hypothetical protein